MKLVRWLLGIYGRADDCGKAAIVAGGFVFIMTAIAVFVVWYGIYTGYIIVA